MEAVAWTLGEEYLCLGITWPEGVPALDLVEVSGAAHVRVPIRQRRFGFKPGTAGRFCIGRYGFVDGTGIELVPCPGQEPAAKGNQCELCAARDEFRFAHHFHLGGYAPDALKRYMAQRHWVYIASFADGGCKVGTASDCRKRSRLDEQGAVMASYLAETEDGASARLVEDSITRELEISQFKHRRSKVTALAAPVEWATIADRHAKIVTRAVELLEGSPLAAQVAIGPQPWQPPDEVTRVFSERPAEGWAIYPHDLREGAHGFHVSGALGPAVFVRTSADADAVGFIADFGSLKGFRIAPGEHVSPESIVQGTLF